MRREWYRIPDARDIRVNRANLTRFTLREPLWDAWCDSIRVLIRVLAWAQPGPQMASRAGHTDRAKKGVVTQIGTR